MRTFLSRAARLGAALALCACGGGAAPAAKPKPDAPPVVTGPFAEHVELRWLPDGSGLLVDGLFRLVPGSGKFFPIGDGATAGDRIYPSPDGRRLLAVRDGALRLLGSPPTTLELPDEVRPGPNDRLASYWQDDDRIYVHRSSPDAAAPACRVYVISESTWRPPSTCLDVNPPVVDEIVSGPGTLIAAYTAGGGPRLLHLLYFDPRRGGRPTPGDPLPSGAPIAVGYASNGVTARLVTRCALTQNTCAADAPARLFHRDLSTGETTEIGAVNAQAVPSPADDTVAWIANGAVCLGLPGGVPRCFAP